MKTNELMLGDWVARNGIERLKVEEIYRNGCIAGGYTLLEDEIIPISITPSILEWNGWNEWHMYYILPIDQQQYMRYYPHNGSLCRFYKHKNGSSEKVAEVNAINYVHLLQHALRLCGIEKDIEL